MKAKHDSIPTWWSMPLRDFIAGTIGGFAGKIIEHPFDTIKVRAQALCLRPTDCLSQLLRNEGTSALYKGLYTPLLGTVLEMSLLFSVNGAIKNYWREHLLNNGTLPPVGTTEAAASNKHEKLYESPSRLCASSCSHTVGQNQLLPLSVEVASGACAGLLVSFVLTPIELVKCRLQMQVPGQIRYDGVFNCFMKSIREDGVRVLFRGHSATMLREVPGTALWFGAYELFLRAFTPVGQSRESLSPWSIIAAGGFGGLIYWTVFYPVDTIKTAMQLKSYRNVQDISFRSTTSALFDRGGIAIFYRGLTPTLLRAVPANAALFGVYEGVSKILISKPGTASPTPTAHSVTY